MSLSKLFNIALDTVRVKLAKPGQVTIVSNDYLDSFPEGDPIPSILPKEGYGNHSCQDCLALHRCPCANFVSQDVGGQDEPNKCSYYWPPSSLKEPGDWYWKELNRTVEYRKKHGMYI